MGWVKDHSANTFQGYQTNTTPSYQKYYDNSYRGKMPIKQGNRGSQFTKKFKRLLIVLTLVILIAIVLYNLIFD